MNRVYTQQVRYQRQAIVKTQGRFEEYSQNPDNVQKQRRAFQYLRSLTMARLRGVSCELGFPIEKSGCQRSSLTTHNQRYIQHTTATTKLLGLINRAANAVPLDSPIEANSTTTPNRLPSLTKRLACNKSYKRKRKNQS